MSTEGNAGYIGGTPPSGAKDRAGVKTTRKTYVLEVETAAARRHREEAEALLAEAESVAQRVRSEESYQGTSYGESYGERKAVRSLPEVEAIKPQGYTDYTVAKNDTLQKISLKFYNTNHKWKKIFDANRNVIKEPSRIKPGMIIRIPQE